MNRNFVQTYDTTKDSEETATTFTVSKISRNGRTKLSLYKAVSFCRIATVEQLQLEYTHTQTQTQTHSQLYRIPRRCGYASKHNYRGMLEALGEPSLSEEKL